MKRLILSITLLAGATSAYSQGLINWTDYVAPSGPNSGFSITVFAQSSSYFINVTPGTGSYPYNTVNDLPAGNATWAGAPMGAGYEIGLYVDTGPAQLENDIYSSAPVATSTFLTAAYAGQWNENDSLIATVSGIPGGTPVYVELTAWSAANGATSFAQAVAQGMPSAVSGPSPNTTILGGIVGGVGPPQEPGTLAGTGLQDFGVILIPEPGIVALTVLGVSTLLLRLRCRKSSWPLKSSNTVSR